MKSTLTAGQELVELLGTQLPNGVIWSAKEKVILGQIEATVGEIETAKELLAAEINSPERSSHRCAELLGEIRVSRAAIVKMTALLDPEMVTVPKSQRHLDAVNVRWHGAGVGGR